MPSIQPSSLQANVTDWWLPDLLHWSSIDQGTNGTVRFLTTVELTGRTLADMPMIAVYRMTCLYLLARLDERSLADAYQSLVDIYSWQIDRTTCLPEATAQTAIPVNRLREEERVPFIIEE